MSRSMIIGSVFVGMVGVLSAQAPMVAFDVTSVKRSAPSGSPTGFVAFQPNGLRIVNTTLREVIRQAYQLQTFQIIGGPDWVSTDRFDVVGQAAATLPDDAPGGASQVRLVMLRSLLATRFQLVAHTEAQELPIYGLVLAHSDGRLGERLKPSTIDCRALPAPTAQPPTPNMFCGGIRAMPGRLMGRSATMRQLALNLSPRVGRIVRDHSGRSEAFDFDVEWNPTSSAIIDSAVFATGNADAGPSLFTALQEQLGLKLESGKGSVEVLVIDEVRTPQPD